MTANDDAFQFLKTRRSAPPKLLRAPYPEGAALQEILETGLRVPDHKKLEPWRLIVLEKAALAALVAQIETLAPDDVPNEEKRAKLIDLYQRAGLVVAVVLSPVENDDVPLWEQEATTAAVCLSLVNAALAKGYGAAWMTGFIARSDKISKFLSIGKGESVMGFIHMGSIEAKPADRPRPNLDQKVKYFNK